MKFVSVVCFVCLSFFCAAQQKLEVLGHSPDLYVEHIVSGGETLQMIGNRYSLAPAKIASYNSIDPNTNPSKNSKLRIPLTKDNLAQTKTDNSLPVYHVVGKGENLYRISTAYNKVAIASIREWNNLKNDVVNGGQSLIIGFIPRGNAAAATDKKDNKAKTTEIADAQPAIDKKRTDKAEPGMGKDSSLNNPPIPAKTKPASKPRDTKLPPDAPIGYAPKDGDEGYFAVAYAQHGSDQLKQFRSGDAATFKTVSGWTDRKYYVLMNDAEVGTIVRITGASKKNICAKVLGPLQEIKGTNILLRMSNAAAAALGAVDAKFPVSVTYFE